MHVWEWQIPVYLFLGGLVAGMMVISGYFLLSGRHKRTRCACFMLPSLSLILLSLGMFALFLDLEHKPYFWRLYTTFKVLSPMSWGSWILLLVYPAILSNLLLRLPAPLAAWQPRLQEFSDRLVSHPMIVKTVGVVNMILGSLLGVYTGILLSTLAARPLWNSALLGPIFLLSGMSAAAAFVHMIARETEEKELLAKADNSFLMAELIFIALFVGGLATSTQLHQQAIGLLLGGPYTAVFWIFVVGLGILFPLVIQMLAVNHKVQHTAVAPILVMLGGLLLRFVIVSAGQLSHWAGN
jgi:formate-dependent nitrite reductase membrane component NrfD